MTNIDSDEVQRRRDERRRDERRRDERRRDERRRDERRRDELSRDRVGCRPMAVTAARRRLTATKPGAPRSSGSSHGPRDPRFNYLTHSHD